MAKDRETVNDKVAKVEDLLKRNEQTILDVIPKWADPERLMRVAFNAVRVNPKLLDADPKSLMSALINSATLGLEPNTPLGLCYLIPFKREIVLVVGYKGLVALAKRSKQIIDVNPQVVYEGELFEYEEGDRPRLQHVPLPPKERGKNRVAAYSRVVLPGGEIPTPVLMWAEEIEAIRKQAPGSKSSESPWNSKLETVVDEMWKKTVIRRHFKLMDLDPTVNRAIALDEQYEAGLSPRDILLDGEDFIIDKPEIGEVKAIEEGGTATQEPPKGKADPPEGKDKGKDKPSNTGDEKGKEEEQPPLDAYDGEAPPPEDKKGEKLAEEVAERETEKLKEPSEAEKLKVNIRELTDALGRDDAEILIMECKDDDDLSVVRARLLKEYNEKMNK